MIEDVVEAIADNVPWDKVGECAVGILAGLLVIGGSIVIVDISLSKLTGKGLFEHIRSKLSGVDDRMHEWISKQRTRNIVIEKLVFSIELCATPIQLMCKGLRCVEIKILGKSYDGIKHDTGETVKFAVKKSEAEGLEGKREIEARLAELGL